MIGIYLSGDLIGMGWQTNGEGVVPMSGTRVEAEMTAFWHLMGFNGRRDSTSKKVAEVAPRRSPDVNGYG